jgi:hypothetical protein
MNLTGVKAKDSYKGILNLAGSNQILDATLRIVTDGMGNNSPLQLSTAKVLLGTTAGGSPQTINIGEASRLGSALYSSTYVVYGDFMELIDNGATAIILPALQAREYYQNKYNNQPVIQQQSSETVDQSRGVPTI